MVEHYKSADQIVAEAMAIFVDTEGMDSAEAESIEQALYWALDQVGVC
jgi:hypothetical protein